jgi:hypothetical protein
MKIIRIESVDRRNAIARGLHLAAMAAVASSLGALSRASAADKLAKAAVQYQDVGNSPGKDCDDCMQFIAGKTPSAKGTCKIVDGEIAPHGHCIAFTPIAKK